jgi:hypothetical protein
LPKRLDDRYIKQEVMSLYEEMNLYHVSIEKTRDFKSVIVNFIDIDDRDQALEGGENPGKVLLKGNTYNAKALDVSVKDQKASTGELDFDLHEQNHELVRIAFNKDPLHAILMQASYMKKSELDQMTQDEALKEAKSFEKSTLFDSVQTKDIKKFLNDQNSVAKSIKNSKANKTQFKQ